MQSGPQPLTWVGRHSAPATRIAGILQAPGGQLARVLNAYHLPCLGTPPGTGIFFGERGDCLNVTISWRKGALSEEEKSLMVAQLRADLLGQPQP